MKEVSTSHGVTVIAIKRSNSPDEIQIDYDKSES